jgi:hypothetical protein
MSGEEQRAALIERYRTAYVKATGRDQPVVTWTGQRFRVGQHHNFTSVGFLAAIGRLEARAKTESEKA